MSIDVHRLPFVLLVGRVVRRGASGGHTLAELVLHQRTELTILDVVYVDVPEVVVIFVVPLLWVLLQRCHAACLALVVGVREPIRDFDLDVLVAVRGVGPLLKVLPQRVRAHVHDEHLPILLGKVLLRGTHEQVHVCLPQGDVALDLLEVADRLGEVSLPAQNVLVLLPQAVALVRHLPPRV